MSAEAPEALVSVKGLTRRFALPSHFLQFNKPVLHALNGVDLTIRRGEAFCVVGESGCGKTTLGRVVMGLLSPSEGEVRFDGARIDALKGAARRPYRRRMQMVFQNPYASLNPRHHIGDAMAEPLRALFPNWSKADIRDKIRETMESVGADPAWMARLPHEFSGGQRQRISIARALAPDPEFIVADEPISALDVSIQAQVLNLMMRAQRERGLTYLFITHDLSVVEHFGDRVAVMYLGAVAELAEARAIFERPRHPYTRLLLSAIPRIQGGAFQTDRRSPGEPPNPVNPPPGCPFAPRCPLANARCEAEKPALLPAEGALVACHAVEEGRD